MICYILFIAIVILFLIPTILLSLITNILSLFSFKSRKKQPRQGQADNAVNEGYKPNVNSGDGRKQKKIFDKNEGEYVDFEEIK